MTDITPEPQTPTPIPTPPPVASKPPATDGKDWQAEAEKWKSLSRKNEETAKANAAAAKRLEELEAASKSELERALDAGRKEGAAKADEQIVAYRQKVNARLVASEVRALAADKQFRDPNMVAKLLDLDEIAVDYDDVVDTAAIVRQLDQLAKDNDWMLKDTGPKRPQGDVGQGPRPPATPEVEPGLGRLRAAYAALPIKK